MSLHPEQPIGLFDSGLGGLTVASAISRILPNEQMIYFGDTFHLPYGDKSAESVKYYSEKITEFLLKKNCKVILVACNTASANAYEDVRRLVGNQALVLDVINPVIAYVAEGSRFKKVGIIGTKGTVSSGTYQTRLAEKKQDVEVKSMPTPLFVPMIEEGFVYDDISNAIIRSYLSREEIKDIEAIILGCTHYPIIKNQISRYYDFKVQVIDSAHIVAESLREMLTEKSLLNSNKKPNHQFFVSDYTDYFKPISRMFFEKEVKLKKVDLWR